MPHETFEAKTKCAILYWTEDKNNTEIKIANLEQNKTTQKLYSQEITTLNYQNKDLVLIPSYYSNNKQTDNQNYWTLTFQQLIDKDIIEVNKNGNLPSGDEIGSRNYLLDGTVPFIRTSDISNLELKNTSQHYTNQEIYERYKNKQNIQSNDILFVKDGRAGEVAVIMPSEEKIVLCSGFYKIRIKPNNYGIDTWNLVFALYNCRVKEQISNLLFRSTIPHLSNRIREVLLTFPKSFEVLQKNSELIKTFLSTKFKLKKNFQLVRNDACSMIVVEKGFCSLHSKKLWAS